MTTKKAEAPTISVFGSKPEGAILVPHSAMNVRNNCQSGQWQIGDADYGSKCEMTIVKFSKYFGTLGMTSNVEWAQIWFFVESGDLPRDTVLVTYIKARSLESFNQKVVEIQSRGVEPATGIFVPEFVKHSGQKPDDNGAVKPINYYSLKWGWKERSDWSGLEKAAAILADPQNVARMTDPRGTERLTCIDKFTPQQLEALLATRETRNIAGNQQAQLPAVSDLF